MIDSYVRTDVGLQPVTDQSYGDRMIEDTTGLQNNANNLPHETFKFLPTPSQQLQLQPFSRQGINWGEIFESPLVDAFISEPAETLTSRNGYTLTEEGQRVLGCIAGQSLLGSLLLQIDPSGNILAAAQAVGPAMGCRTTTGTNFDPFVQDDDSNPIGGILEGLFGNQE